MRVDGALVGAAVGENVGANVGATVGTAVVGIEVGAAVGVEVGRRVSKDWVKESCHEEPSGCPSLALWWRILLTGDPLTIVMSKATITTPQLASSRNIAFAGKQ
jgi:hypothetical protein